MSTIPISNVKAIPVSYNYLLKKVKFKVKNEKNVYTRQRIITFQVCFGHLCAVFACSALFEK